MMRVVHNLSDLPANMDFTVISIGNFDGVHCGHEKVLGEVVRRARELRTAAMAVTFEPHPLRVLRPESTLRLITPLSLKLKLLAEAGLDATVVIPFTQAFSQIQPHEFAKNIIVQKLRAKEVHEGANFHFGHRALGNVNTLAEFGQEFGFGVHVYAEMQLRGETVSSSRIRQLISEGRVHRARTLLGRNFAISSTPAKGRGYGSKYTVPTINLADYIELAPAYGVYITHTRVGEEKFDSVTNVGIRPTFANASFAIETHLLNFHPLAINESTQLEVAFLSRVRTEMKFPSAEALREQIQRDLRRAQRYFQLEKRFTHHIHAPATSQH